MDDFSSELFSSFFDDHLLERPLLADRVSFLHMDIESSPGQPPFPLPPSTSRAFFVFICLGF